MHTEHVKIALAIIERDNRILLLHRRDLEPQWDGKWEFPGGKIEAGEQPDQAVHREVQEETGLTIDEAALLCVHHHDWHLEDRTLHVELYCFTASNREGDFHLEPEKCSEARWVDVQEALTYDCLVANHDLLLKYVSHLDRN
ncbi:NUDIX domain-containing protein [Candidatus Uhrbacteria bacterium]|nr:NUDIX domain-containing protein [Candidatus Uhrbacteria bacterium]